MGKKEGNQKKSKMTPSRYQETPGGGKSKKEILSIQTLGISSVVIIQAVCYPEVRGLLIVHTHEEKDQLRVKKEGKKV